ncbi:restriction endonuclease [Mesorhizobium sp. WSM1293]|uniref:restriction endonuclease n=1 Tax=Mesorhizobium sp. WSM1293 TaxID=1040984 RepID=UPI00047FC34C|nr:restriction endonuclease [Mesorhizobium sp. WSM1293]
MNKMEDDSGGNARTLEIDLGEEFEMDLATLDPHAYDRIFVYVPLPSFGSTQSYRDICGDLLDASWAIERMAAHAKCVRTENPPGDYRCIRAVLTGPRPGIFCAIADCALLLGELEDVTDDAGLEELQNLREQVYEYEDKLETLVPRAPEIIDWYFANLHEVNSELRSEAPGAWSSQMKRFPERRLGFHRSGFSGILGGSCYASRTGWLVPVAIGPDRFFVGTDQKYRLNDFLPADFVIINGESFVHHKGLLVRFPSGLYFESQVCAGLVTQDDEYAERWSSDPFSALRSPIAEQAAPVGISTSDAPEGTSTLKEGCYLHETGTLAFVNDGYFLHFLHFLYDIRPAQLQTAKALREASAQMTEELSTATGAAPFFQCDWTSLDDEAFEELCYQLIFDNPKFNSDTIRKLGKSRSRDGGRDIIIHEATIGPWVKPKKWTFQCKLVTNGSSLGATRLTDVGDMLEQYGAQGFGVITSAQMDATLYDKLDAICSKRQVDQYHLSVLELERALGRNRRVRQKFFPGS